MKKLNLAAVAVAFTLLLAASSQATLVLVNDFESGLTGVNSNGDVTIATDPDDGSNNALKATGASGAFDAHVGGFSIADNSVGTVFVRVRLTDASGSNPGTRGGFSVTDRDWTGAEAQTQDVFNARTHVESVRTFDAPGRRTQTGVYDGNVKNSDENVQANAPNAWQSFWFVLNTTDDTFELYVEGGGFAAQTQVMGDSLGIFDWYRSDKEDAAGVMQGFYVYGSDSANNVAYYDDIYVDSTGVDLSNPLTAVPEPSSFLFGLVAMAAGALRLRSRKS